MSRIEGGRIDRSAPFTITVDGHEVEAFAGDTVASALVAAGRLRVGDSIYLGRPRGILTAGNDEPNALVTVAAPAGGPHESMLTATTVEAYPGLVATTLSGLGTLDPTREVGYTDKMYVHADVLVIGAGPSGLAAATTAAATGARVVLVDEQPELGGSLLSSRDEQIDGQDSETWVAARRAELDAAAECTVLTRTSALGSYDSNYVVAVEKRTAHLGADAPAGQPRERLWHVRAAQVVLATGATERPIVFEGNDRPGVMLGSAVRTYLNRYAASAGRRAVVMTVDDSGYQTARDLVSTGTEVVAVVDSREQPSATAPDAVQVFTGSAVTSTQGSPELASVRVHGLDADGQLAGDARDLACDLLAVSGGWSPSVALHSQRQGKLAWRDDVAAFVPAEPVRDQHVVGGAAGLAHTDDAVATGAHAGAAAAAAAGFGIDPGEAPQPAAPGEIRPLWLVPGESGGPAEWRDHVVDPHRDQTVADVWRATGAGMHNVEHVKRYTSISTGADQGKSSAVAAIGVIAQALGGPTSPGSVGTTTFRAPTTPVAFSTLAGQAAGDLYDPVRTTSVHAWHVEHGAEFEIVGPWMRPFYYPQPGEDMHAAVLRECAAVRESVGMMDASTLGKIEVCGPDAGEFLNRVYTNGFKKLAVDKARYGVMCGVDGMVIDDGVTIRLADDRYFMTTTTGGAAHIYEWLEEWLQTEWPDLDVTLTSVTEQWTTVAVAGPRSRDVVGAVCPDLDVSKDGFGFMEVRHTTLSNGLEARVARISFSGELAYELSVPGWYGRALWELLWDAGQAYGITPYGTETMHVLRAEKGYPIVGQDTDGTVTPHDLGMSWVVSKLKDFVGKRSFDRDDTSRLDRKHLMGLLPVDGTTRMPEGTQLVAEGASIDPSGGPVPMEGFVTSSYDSAALGRPFGLGLVRNGQNLVGQHVQAVVDGRSVLCEITSPVLYDPEGNRRDG